ncbi:MAG: hypothetical protein ACJARI_002182, partial [Bacteroidia bacterium]
KREFYHPVGIQIQSVSPMKIVTAPPLMLA